MDTLEKAGLTASIRHIAILLKSEIPIYNSEVPDTAGRKTRRRRTHAIAKRYALYANATRRTQAIATCYSFHANVIIAKLRKFIRVRYHKLTMK